MLKKLFGFIFVITLISPINYSFAYAPETTHAGLSQEIISFYNRGFKNQITDSQKELIIQGSIDEDYPASRVLNHFYDPVRNIGLNNYYSSKDWGSGKVLENDFSWHRAIEYYAKGEENKAYMALGHVLHLLEDASVPDHTRNDPHSEFTRTGFHSDSPYENWAAKNKNRQTLNGLGYTFFILGLKPKIENNLDEYFDFIANYSNKNFFSKDTIDNNIYQYQNPRMEEITDGYGYRKNEEGKKVKLLIVKDSKDGNVLKVLSDKDDESVLAEYFEELSKQIIPAGAGVIDLFLRQGNMAKEKYQKEEEERKKKAEAAEVTEAKVRTSLEKGNILAKVIYWTQYTWEYNISKKAWAAVSRIRQKFETPSAILAQNIPNVLSALGFTSNIVAKTSALVAAENTKTIQQDTVTFVQKQNPAVFTVGPAFAFRKKAAQANPEAKPPENTATSPLIPVVIPISPIPTSPPPPSLFSIIPGFGGGGGLPILSTVAELPVEVVTLTEEATSTATSTPEVVTDTTPPHISATLHCTHSLLPSSCFVATSTSALSWNSTSNDVASYAVLIDEVLSATSTETAAEISLIEGSHEIKVIAHDNSGNAGTSTSLFIEYMLRPIVISEIAWAGTDESSGNEWLELYNRSQHSIDLSSIKLKALDGTPDLNLSGIMAPQTYFLIERTDDESVPNIAADHVIPFSGSHGSGLSNDGEDLILSQNSGGTEIILDSTPSTIFCQGWCYGNENVFSTMTRTNLNGDGSGSANWATDIHYVKSIFDALGFKLRGSPKGAIENECLNINNTAGSSGSRSKGDADIEDRSAKYKLATILIIIDPCEENEEVVVGEI